MLYPQNGDRIVAIDNVTLLHPMYRPSPSMTTDQDNLDKITNSSRPKYSCSNENTNLLG